MKPRSSLSTWMPALAGGALLGAACFANYLAAFVACAALAWCGVRRRPAECLAAGIGAALWLPAGLWFFAAQRQSRAGQFAPFDAAAVLIRLARDSAAALFGGLPLYVDGSVRVVVGAALGLGLVALAALAVRRWRGMATPEIRPLLAMAAAAPAIGLLLLGLAFDSTPIEVRYLAFATPFVGLLLAASLPPRVIVAVLTIQAMAIIGLMTRPETMQPARAAAAAAASLVQDGIVLLPHGNDGVGIVGAFAVEAPPEMRLLVIRRDASAAQIRASVGDAGRVVLVLLGQDADSRATLPVMREAFATPCWRTAGEGANAIAFERVCHRE